MVTPDALFTLFGMSTKLFLIHFHLYVRFFFFFSFVFALVSFLSEPSSAIPAHESQKKNKRICSSFNDGSLLDLYPLSLSLSLSTFNRLFHLILHFLSPALFVWVFILDPRLESKCFVYFFIIILGSRGAPPRAVDGGGTF